MSIDPVSIAITIALSAASMALQASTTTEGPRLQSTKVQLGDYGQPLPLIFGLARVPGLPIWAEDLREVKVHRKTKGGKYNDYTYYGTWAVAFSGNEVTNVVKIWFDDAQLVYDASGSGPVSPFTFTEKDNPPVTDLFKLYLGTETQTADPTMKASIEAEFGVGWCPAHRGTGYCVFVNVPLEKFGNRLVQTEFEVNGIMDSAPLYAEFEVTLPSMLTTWPGTPSLSPFEDIDIGGSGGFVIPEVGNVFSDSLYPNTTVINHISDWGGYGGSLPPDTKVWEWTRTNKQDQFIIKVYQAFWGPPDHPSSALPIVLLGLASEWDSVNPLTITVRQRNPGEDWVDLVQTGESSPYTTTIGSTNVVVHETVFASNPWDGT